MAKKADVLKTKGIKIRKTTSSDLKKAKTDYQRNAGYLITTSNGQTYFSKNGSLADCLWAEETSKKSALSKQKPSSKKTTAKTQKVVRKTKVQKAEELRLKAVGDFNKMKRVTAQWVERNKKSKTTKEIKEVDATYQKKFEQAEKREHASYSAYYDYVNKNFTMEQQIKAMQVSKNFMSKKYTNALAGGKNGKK